MYNQEWIKSPYFYTFMKSITYRENCYTCKYAQKARVSDIMIGDFWGLKEDSRFYSSKNDGVSVIFIITPKGKKYIEKVAEKIEFENRDIEEAVSGNDQLRAPAQKKQQTIDFKKTYIKNRNFFKTYKKVCRKNFYKQAIKSNKLIKKILMLRNEVRNVKK